MTYKLLIVDDEMANLRLLERMFTRDYYCLTASSAEEAIGVLEQHDVAVIITDQRMPHITGIELLKRTADTRPHMVRILLTGYTDVEALAEAINCGLVYMYVSKPWKNQDLKLHVSKAIQHYEDNKTRHSLVHANERLLARLKDMKLGFVRAIATTLKLKDEYSYSHGSRVGRCASLLGENLGLNEELLSDLSAAAFLHDVGKIGTPDQLLSTTAPLAADEQQLWQQHSEQGAQILSLIPELREVADIVRYHHENYDGTGYPVGLIGDQIPLTSRIIRVTDEYDLLLKPRDRSRALSHDETLAILSGRAGKDFDEKVVRVLKEVDPNNFSEVYELNAAPVWSEFMSYAVN